MRVSESNKVRVESKMAVGEDFAKKYHRNNAIDYLFWGLAAKCPAIKEEKSIVVLTEVARDGKGDWIAAKSVAEYMQKKFPECTVHLIVNSPEIHRDQLLAPKLKSVSITYEDDRMDYTKEKRENKRIEEASLVLIGPLCPRRRGFSKIKKIISHKTFSFTEYDAPTNLYSHYKYSNSPRHDSLRLGLSSTAIGIFTKSPNKKYDWSDIEHSQLKEILFGEKNPDQESIVEYQRTHSLFLCYMSLMNSVEFIEDTLKFENNGIQHIDICFPGKKSIEGLEFDVRQINRKTQLIQSVKIITCGRWGETKEKFSRFQEEGVELRIIDPGLLSARDFKILSQISGKLMGVSSDHSLGQALSYGKIPSFVRPEGHKLHLLKCFFELIEENFGRESPLFQYVHAVGKGEKSKFYPQKGSLLANPELSRQAEMLGEIIQKDFSVKSYFYGMANEFFLKQCDPEYAAKAAEHRRKYIEGEVLIEQVEEEITAELTNRGLLNPQV